MEVRCSKLRRVVNECLFNNLHSAAIFYADKLVSFSGYNADDRLLLARCYFANKEYRRALSVLNEVTDHYQYDSPVQFKCLIAQCLAACGDWEECLIITSEEETDFCNNDARRACNQGLQHGPLISESAILCLLRGRAFEAFQNRTQAVVWYKEALKRDAYCYDAFSSLIDGNMLTNEEELSLVKDLLISDRDEWMRLIYRCKCKKYVEPSAVQSMLDVLEAAASSGAEDYVPNHQTIIHHQPNHHQQQQVFSTTASPAAASMAAAAGRPRDSVVVSLRYTPVDHHHHHHHHYPRSISHAPVHAATYNGPSRVPSAATDTTAPSHAPVHAATYNGPSRVPAAAAAATDTTAPSHAVHLHQLCNQHSVAAGASYHLPSGIESASWTNSVEATPAAAARKLQETPATSSFTFSGFMPASGSPMAITPLPFHDNTNLHGTTSAAQPGNTLTQEATTRPIISLGVALSSRFTDVKGGDKELSGLHSRLNPYIGTHSSAEPAKLDVTSDANVLDRAHYSEVNVLREGPVSAVSIVDTVMDTTSDTPLAPASNDLANLNRHDACEDPPGGVTTAGSSIIQSGNVPAEQSASHATAAGSRSPRGYGLSSSSDVQCCRADLLFTRGQYEKCFSLTSSVLQRDPLSLQALVIHASTALQLGKKNDLFILGHKLTEEHPQEAVSWYIVGCYYMCTRQYEQARKHFGKATTLNSGFAAAWMGYGHAFAAQDERDQAMAAYRTAARLFPGLHLPLLGMGMEYSQMNNLQLAERMLLSAHRLCPMDASCSHELGVINFKNGRLAAAIMWLRNAISLFPNSGDCAAGEPSLVAMGHCMRKERRYQDALDYYSRALIISPSQASTHSAVGLTHQLMGCPDLSVQSYHTALSLRPDDAIASDMLGRALQDFAGID
ncbi:hypothetical protein CEUSTIGMA_g8320.t1 [Chlamydomonas eustigma]|uniref:Uncharacterized protein n=1 Tax=Chlamydomonas eustigma TaxID=1157962 RepID=A0A250XCR8_9CHLO|nr:hypothetical protein CEUSTIGMA_g8320.t1 [Chlamydomonas eustigma]|eukprot:GAX80885.1 hypothetical protein CEUSTIGMA_g8320.t1 [Chlamydomonas eustigma]